MNSFLLHHLLSESASRQPDRVALVMKDQSMTYGALEAVSSQLALALIDAGVRPGDRVGILLGKSLSSVVSVFGILKAGAAYVPIDPLAPASRMHYMINNCAIDCVVTSSRHLEKLVPGTDGARPLRRVILTDETADGTGVCGDNVGVTPWSAVLAESPGHFQAPGRSDVGLAYILHTSGSTGVPKGVAISHVNALTFVNMAADFFGIQGEDRFASLAPLHFDLSVFDIFAAVGKGAAIVLVPEGFTTFPVQLAEYVERQAVSIWNSAASVLCLLADRGRLDRFAFERLRLVHFSGDLMPVKYLRLLMQQMKGAAFYNIYGQTEANSSLFYPVTEIPRHDAWRIPIGRAFPNFEVFALDDQGSPVVSPGEKGELYVRASTVALGYWNDHERTAEKFVSDPLHPEASSKVYRTGDLVELDHDGNYVFAGRRDHMVKSRGYRIELSEIEVALGSHPSVRQVAVLALPDELIGSRIVGYVAVVEGTELSASELSRYCNAFMPNYMVPETILLRSSLPLTSSGKIDRKALEISAVNELTT